MAGLAAAHELHKAGWKVTVLEARGRVGGRVHTIRDFSNGMTAEGGAEYIDEDHTRVIDLAHEFNLTLGAVGSWQVQSGDWSAFEGKRGSIRDSKVWGLDLEQEYAKVWKSLADFGEQVPDPAKPASAPNAKTLDTQNARDWIEALDVHPLAQAMFINHIRSEFTCEPENFSLLDLARNASLYYREEGGWKPAYRVVGGNDQIPQAIANRLPDVRLNAEVNAIRVLAEEVTVKYKQLDSFHTIQAAYAILATPLTTGRLIDFEGTLPAPHMAMLNGLTYGMVTKVMIQYRKRFWRDHGWNGRLSTDLPIVYTWDATSHLETDGGILTAYTGGGPGAALTQMTDEERIRTVVFAIESLFPGSSDLIEATRTIAWGNEPFTRGSYMAYAPTEITAYWNALFTPAGRLHFAGEHATVLQGYMEGAVESGQRAARMIIKENA